MCAPIGRTLGPVSHPLAAGQRSIQIDPRQQTDVTRLIGERVSVVPSSDARNRIFLTSQPSVRNTQLCYFQNLKAFQGVGTWWVQI